MEERKENVSMKSSGNRVVDDLVKWMAEEAQDKKLFGADVTQKKHYAEEKYFYYKELREKYARTASPEEKRYLNKIKGEMQDLKMVAYPKKFERYVFNTTEFLLDFANFYIKAGEAFGKFVKTLLDRRKEQVLQNLPIDIKDPKVLATRRQFEEAVKPVIENRYQKTVGPDRDLRRNNPNTERGEEEKVRFKIEDDFSLLPKKASKNQGVANSKEELLPKNRESTGKGLTI